MWLRYVDKIFDVAIIGGGILGTALSYFISASKIAKRVAVIEQAPRVAFHTSGRNTGKVHAPYLYNPQRKKLFAKTAFLGYDMWSEYCSKSKIPFKKDGVVEVAPDQGDVDTLAKYMRWGIENGLEENRDITMMSGRQLQETEPNVKCESALVISREGSVDYAHLTRHLMDDSMANGTVFFLNRRVTEIRRTANGWDIPTLPAPANGSTLQARRLGRRRAVHTGAARADNASGNVIKCRFLVNAAGGESVDIAHSIGIADDLTDVHFRGEYWRAPAQYANLTKTSIYSVPDFPTIHF